MFKLYYPLFLYVLQDINFEFIFRLLETFLRHADEMLESNVQNLSESEKKLRCPCN